MAVTGPILVKKRDERVLMVSPCAEIRKKTLIAIGPQSLAATEAMGGADALLRLRENDFRTILLDPNIEDLNLEELIGTIRARYPDSNVIILDHEPAVRPPSLAPSDMSRSERTKATHPDLPKPLIAKTLFDSVGAVSQAPPEKTDALPGMIGSGQKMQQIYRLARLVAAGDTAVLIGGATGTGKELVARGIHRLSRRNERPFVVVNCAAIPEALLEAELFGFTRGAFTGAFQSRVGRIHSAHGGTLLLDEIGELPLSMQAKLLRFVQEGEVQRLGSSDIFRVDVRLITSTNADLLQRVREKQFREDLYYRVAVFPLDLPPLRDRVEDILPLALHFLEVLRRRADVPEKLFTLDAVILLQKYAWPGNVRELQHLIERAFILSESNKQIQAENLAMSAGTI
jgi:DNA-binding NtrC family response regulator